MRARRLLGATIVAVTLAGCGAQGTGGGESAAAPGATPIGYSYRYVSDPFQAAEVKLIEEQAKAQNIDLQGVNANNDPAKQNTDIDSLLSRGIKGLLLNPVDPDAVVPAIKKANAAKIPVVAVDVNANGGDVAMQVTTDNYAAGALGCEAMAPLVNNRGTVLNLQGSLSDNAGRDRSNGFTECMAQKYPDITVVSKPMDWSADKCAAVAQTTLSSTQIDGVYSAATMLCMGPVTNALKSLNRFFPAGDPKHVPFVAIDGTPPELAAIRDGTIDAVVSQPLDSFAKYGFYWLDRAMKGEPITEGPTDHGSKVVNLDGRLVDQLQPTTVTKENASSPSVWGNQ